MTITLLCSCGLAIASGGQTLLIDALTESCPPFYQTPEETRRQILQAEGTFSHVCGLLFTHLHPDHFSRADAECFEALHPATRVFIPKGKGDDEICLQAGAFSVSGRRALHTPVPGFGQSTVYLMTVAAEGKMIYITSDAAPDAETHRAFLVGRQMDAAFWNGQYLSYPQTRALLRDCARQNFIYHFPIDPNDGTRRKAQKNMERYPQELQSVTLLTQNPTTLTI